MKIKFIKEYVAVDPTTNSGILHRIGTTEEIKGATAQWLIDNGFAEEVKESGWWKPKLHGKYYFLSNVGEVLDEPWLDSGVDESRYSVGNCFKTEDAAERYKEYLEAIATVRQDEAVLTPEKIYRLGEGSGEVYHIGHVDNLNGEKLLDVCAMDLYGMWAPVGATLFETEEHAEASLKKHQDEWKIIASYDWSRG